MTSPPLDLYPRFPVDPIRRNPRKPDPFAAEVFIFRAEGGEKTSIHKGRALPLAWSPDGEWIVCLRTVDHDAPRSTTLTLIRSDGSVERDIAPVGLPGVVTWSPDGSRIAFWMLGLGPDESQAHVVRIDGTEEMIPLRTRGAAVDVLAWSPDGRFIVTAATPRSDGNALPGDKEDIDALMNIYLIPLDGSESVQLTSDDTPNSHNVCPFWVVAKK